MDNKGKNRKNGKNGGPKKNMMGIVSIIVWAIVIVVLINHFVASAALSGQVELKFSDVISLVKNDEVEEVKLENGKYTITLKEDAQKTWMQDYYGDEYNDKLQMPVLYTAPLSYTDFLLLLDEHGVSYYTPYQSNSAITQFLISYLLPTLVMVGAMILLFRVMMGGKMGGGMGIGSVGKSNAKMYVEKSTGVTFKDVAGQDEAKESLEEIIDFLHNPGKYTAIGAKLPKGALLVGSPGTGKTLLAKAVAGEAKVPFFSISGSDFVEMFVGVGASRVRDLFKEAAKMAPCIIFIDEIDTIGKKRDGGQYGGGNDEREQTLNQLLTEMDGFDGSKGVVILAATNRPESLDPALLRPGRFDRRIPVELPDLQGRIDILKVHAQKIKLAGNVDFSAIARTAAGASGAELANIINEAALRAVRLGRSCATQEDLMESVEVVIAGYQKKNRVLSNKEKLIVSYHEVGHALVAALQSQSAPVQKITIIPRTSGALGYTMQVDEGEHYLMTKTEMVNKIATLTGGRAAEELIFHEITTGASNDIEQATKLARSMVSRYGMSDEFGMVAMETVQSQYLGGDASLTCSMETQTKIDKKVTEIIGEQYRRAIEMLQEHMPKLHEIAKYLYEHETITGEEFMQILNRPMLTQNPEQAE